MCLVGEDNTSTIFGVSVWRSQNLAYKLFPDWCEVYNWMKLEPKFEEME